MSVSWYSVNIYPQSGGTAYFNGYFSVDDTTNLVTGFYNAANVGVNILGPSTFPPPMNTYTANNIFDRSTLFFTFDGMNFTSSNLQTTLSSTYPYFNLYFDSGTSPTNNTLWQDGYNITTNVLIQPIPIVLSPNFGTINGGTNVTVVGINTNFVSGSTSVTIGGVSASNITVINPTELTCTTPINTSGTKNVVITTPSGTVSDTNGFTYYGTPTITTITPNIGLTTGGTLVTINGADFIPGNTTVTFGGVSATSVNVSSSTQLTCNTPSSGFSGPVNVTVTTSIGLVTEFNGFEYTAVCFHEDTEILTIDGYVPIKNLKRGYLVKTYKHGFKPIYMIGYSKIYNSGDNERVINRLYKYSKTDFNELFDDLLLTGGHSILVDEYKDEIQREENETVFTTKNYIIDDKICLVSYINKNAIPYEKEGIFTIYHIALENNDESGNYGIYANGLLVEAIDINCMKQYSNMIFIN